MPRGRDSRRDDAYKMWRRSRGKKKLSDIAAKLGVAASTVRKWKSQDDWEGMAAAGSAPKRRGGQPGNCNAAGNHARGSDGNRNAQTHGAYARLMADRMSQDEREVWGEDYGADTLEAMRLEVRTINVQQLRLMTRLHEITQQADALRDVLAALESEQGGDHMQITDEGIMLMLGCEVDKDALDGMPDARAQLIMRAIDVRMEEVYKLEHVLDRSSARKTRLLQIIYDAQAARREQGSVEVCFGGIDAPGEPDHGEEGGV